MNYNIIQFNITYKQLQRRVAEKCQSKGQNWTSNSDIRIALDYNKLQLVKKFSIRFKMCQCATMLLQLNS